MTITYPLALPTATAIKSLRFLPEVSAGIARSPWTLQRQAQLNQGHVWAFEAILPPMKETDADAWITWRLKLKGPFGTFLMGDPLRVSPRGTGSGTPLVNGASQTGDNLVTDGWAASQIVLKAGDYVQLGSGLSTRLHKVLDDVTSDGAGNATLMLWPPVRPGDSPADTAALTINNTVGLFSMADSKIEWNVDEAQIYGLTFTAVEAL